MQSARYSCQILMKLDSFRPIFEKNTQLPNYMKIPPVGAEFPHVGGRT